MNFLKKILYLIKLGLVFCIFHSMAFASSLQVVIYTEEWPPLNYLGANGEVRGFVTDRVRALMDAAEISYDIQLIFWARANKITLTTPNTLLYTMLKTPEREDLFHWYCPIAEPQQLSLFKLTSRKEINLSELDNAKDFILGVIRGGYSSKYLLSQGFSADENLVFVTNDDIAVKQLLNGRIDLIAQSKSALHYRLNKLGLTTDVVTEALGSIDSVQQEACLVINKNSDAKLIAALDKAFARLKLLETSPPKIH